MFQHSEYWLATIILGSILGGLVVLVGIGIYKRDAVLDKLEEFLRRRKTARSRDQPQEMADLQSQDQQQQHQQQNQPQQQTQPQQFQSWEDAEPANPQIRLQVWPDVRAQPWPNNWPEAWPEVRPQTQGAAEHIYENVTDEAPLANVADKVPPTLTKEAIEAFLSLAAAVAAAGRQKDATDVAENEAQANVADEAQANVADEVQANVADEAQDPQPPQDYVFDSKIT